MGIDIYAKWSGITPEEEQAQYTGFSLVAGRVGYLREAYHGGPYATRVLVPEAFASDDGEAPIPAATMRERIPETIQTAITRAKQVYNEDIDENSPDIRTFSEFVDLCERKEEETGKPVTIIASY